MEKCNRMTDASDAIIDACGKVKVTTVNVSGWQERMGNTHQ